MANIKYRPFKFSVYKCTIQIPVLANTFAAFHAIEATRCKTLN
jgi:hypothetical protein